MWTIAYRSLYVSPLLNVDLHNTWSGQNYDDKPLNILIPVDKKYVIMSRYGIPTYWHLYIYQLEATWIFCILMAKRTCNIWRNVLSRICRSNGPQFKPFVDTLIHDKLNVRPNISWAEIEVPKAKSEYTEITLSFVITFVMLEIMLECITNVTFIIVKDI